MERQIAPAFRRYYGQLLGDEQDTFLSYCTTSVTQSIRLNSLKYDPTVIYQQLQDGGWQLAPIPWHSHSYWVTEAPVTVGTSVAHAMDYFYMQDAVSLIPAHVLQPSTTETVLDMAAAPGSKTGQMAEHMFNSGCIVANDIRLERIKALKANLEKVGVLNTLITRQDGRAFVRQPEAFDAVLVDAPCSSDGTVRQRPHLLSEWNADRAASMASLQRQLLEAALATVTPGGYVVYATCALTVEENEAVVDAILQSHDVTLANVSVPGLVAREGIVSWNDATYAESIRHCARIWPHDNNTNGFFVALLQKGE